MADLLRRWSTSARSVACALPSNARDEPATPRVPASPVEARGPVPTVPRAFRSVRVVANDQHGLAQLRTPLHAHAALANLSCAVLPVRFNRRSSRRDGVAPVVRHESAYASRLTSRYWPLRLKRRAAGSHSRPTPLFLPPHRLPPALESPSWAQVVEARRRAGCDSLSADVRLHIDDDR